MRIRRNAPIMAAGFDDDPTMVGEAIEDTVDDIADAYFMANYIKKLKENE